MTAAPDSPAPVLVVRGPDCLPALVPHLLGFHPASSLVVLGIAPEGRTVRVTLRHDLPDGDAPVPEAWAASGAALARAGATSAVLVVYPAPADDPWRGRVAEALPHAELVESCADALVADGVRPLDAVCVVGDRLRSYWCVDDACCPPEGRRLPVGEALGVDAAFVVHGSAPLPSREALVATLDPRVEGDPVLDAVRRERARLGGSPVLGVADVDSFLVGLRSWQGRRADSGLLPVLVALVTELCGRVCPRDLLLHALTVDTGPDQVVLAREVLVEAVRCAPEADAAPVASVLAVCAWITGDGAASRVALDRALAADPAYSLAALVSAALDAGTPPWTWTAMMADLTVETILATSGGRERLDDSPGLDGVDDDLDDGLDDLRGDDADLPWV